MTRQIQNLSLEECKADASRCIGCGTCLTTCPVYGEDPREMLTARGRNANLPRLIREAEQQGLTESLSKCLLCGRCAMVCPQGIRSDMIVAALREVAVRSHGLPILKKAVFRSVLANRKRMAGLLRAASKLQGVLPPSRGVELSMAGDGARRQPVRHLPMLFSGMAGGRNFPSLSDTFLSEALAEVTAPAAKTDKPLRAAFFSGCSMEFMLPGTGIAMAGLLSKLGVEVIFPREQGCCGLAAHVNGDSDTALAMALHNAAVLERCRADVIVTGCATCGSALRDTWPSLAAGTEDKKRLAALAAKTRDFSELLMDLSFPEPFRYVSTLPEDARVAWHSPCHLVQHQQVSREPLTLLRRTLGGRFVPLPSRCCGFGGSFNVSHYGLSQEIARNKARDLEASGAQYVVTDCPGCMIQLADLAVHHGISCKVLHLAEAVTIQ